MGTALEAPNAIARTPGKYERLCWERHERDLAACYPDGIVPDDPADARALTRHPKGLWFDVEAAARVIDFLETFCKHHKGEWAGEPLLLEEWQKDVLTIAFGWMRADGTRRFRIIYVEIPRKNGKSEVAAGLGLYMLVADREPGGEVYASATKKDQAKIVHGTAAEMVKASPELRQFVGVFRNNLHCPELGSKFEPLGSDSNTLDGLNPHCNIVDELHAHRDRGVWDVLDTAMGARRQPLTIAITTAGVYAPESIGWLQHDHATKVLEGALEDDGFFAFIACADEDDDPYAPETWAKANPNIGVSVKAEYLAEQAGKAAAQPQFLNTFLRLHLNRWTEQLNRWIAMDQWNACEAPLSRGEMLAREELLAGRACYAGMDLSTKLDITALVLAFPPIAEGDDAWPLVCRFYVPQENVMLRVRRDRVPYDAWIRDGWLLATPGNVIDYAFIQRDLLALAAKYSLQEVAFDPWNATQLANDLMGEGIQMVETRQGYKTMSEPSKEFQAMIAAKRIRHGGHPVLRWHVSNVAVRMDPNENIAPNKEASAERIDGAVATIMALSRGVLQPPASVYESRGLLDL